MRALHVERHFIGRSGWLRAAVLGANDGIISTASLIVGVASAGGTLTAVITAGVAGMIAGSMSMAAGEYVSVSSQSDTEKADLARETRELASDPEGEANELAKIYIDRGVTPGTARQVAAQLMARSALDAHARDELGITEMTSPKPIQAALASAAAFALGAALPLLVMLAVPQRLVAPGVAGASVLALALLGAVGAKTGGAGALKPAARVAFWGALAMAITAGVGALVGTAI